MSGLPDETYPEPVVLGGRFSRGTPPTYRQTLQHHLDIADEKELQWWVLNNYVHVHFHYDGQIYRLDLEDLDKHYVRATRIEFVSEDGDITGTLDLRAGRMNSQINIR